MKIMHKYKITRFMKTYKYLLVKWKIINNLKNKNNVYQNKNTLSVLTLTTPLIDVMRVQICFFGVCE